jgi:tetratricopeptide (TPR) repeat protein
MRSVLPTLLLLLLPLTAAAQAGPPQPPGAPGDLAAAVRVHSAGDGLEWTATGVVVDRSGVVLTSARAIGCVDTIQVAQGAQDPLDATLLYLDDEVDLAILKVRPTRKSPLNVAELGQAPAVGATAWTWGAGSGDRSGPITRSTDEVLELRADSVGADAGSPVIDELGHVVGLVSSSDLVHRQGEQRSSGPATGVLIPAVAASAGGKVPRRILCSAQRRTWHDLLVAAHHHRRGNIEYAESALTLTLGRQLSDDLKLQVLMVRATLREQLGQVEGAIVDLTVALDRTPGDFEALAARGRLLVRTREYDKALSDLDMALELRPDQVRLQASRARALFELDRKIEALAALRRWLAVGPATADDLGLQCRIQIDMNELSGLSRACDEAVDAGWREPHTLLALAEVRRQVGDLQGALGALDLAVEAGSTDPAALHNRSLYLLHFERTEDALADAEALIAAHPELGAAWYVKAYALGLLGRRDEAIAAAARSGELGDAAGAQLEEHLKFGGRLGRLEMR